MSFGLRVSFGRICNRDRKVCGSMRIERDNRDTLENLSRLCGIPIVDDPAKKSPKYRAAKFGRTEVWVKSAPVEPTRTVRNAPWTYYYDDDGDCYGAVRDYERIAEDAN